MEVHALKGKTVRIINDSAGEELFGRQGVVESVSLAEGACSHAPENYKVKVVGLRIQGQAHTLTGAQVQDCSMFSPYLPGKTIKKLLKLEGLLWLEEVGMGGMTSPGDVDKWVKESAPAWRSQELCCTVS